MSKFIFKRRLVNQYGSFIKRSQPYQLDNSNLCFDQLSYNTRDVESTYDLEEDLIDDHDQPIINLGLDLPLLGHYKYESTVGCFWYDNIQYLTSKSIPEVLPKSLKVLKLTRSIKHAILPPVYAIQCHNFDDGSVDYIDPSTKRLSFRGKNIKLPDLTRTSLEVLSLEDTTRPVQIPDTLRVLRIPSMDVLPDLKNVKVLITYKFVDRFPKMKLDKLACNPRADHSMVDCDHIIYL